MKIAALVLAAGRSSRMGGAHKLLADLGGAPLIARVVGHVAASRAAPIVVVTGHQRDEVIAAASRSGAGFDEVYNPDFADGMASSLRAGLLALPEDCDGALVALGDMPLIGAEVFDRLIAEAEARPAASAIVPTVEGSWAHPVLLRQSLFAEIMALSGDTGARPLLARRDDVATLAFDDAALLLDADDPVALARLEEEWALRNER
ncbi:MAG: hypothetical protein BGP06_02660 [Rhizobiales bacterium 65-9]|nr:MAG: hypothetical protein BGP06_02660 [Rhizobiales bacterium 65-9]